MPTFCAVVGCGRRGNRDKNSFYRLPCIPKGGRGSDSTLINIKTKRRLKWILALRRKDLTETKLKYMVICDRHFISGRPAGNYDIENPDWVPSLNMGYPDKSQKAANTSPLIEYIRTSVVSQNETADSNQSSLSGDIEDLHRLIEGQSSSVSENPGGSSITYQDTLAEENIVKEENSTEEFLEYDKTNTSNVHSFEESTSDKHIWSDCISNVSELHPNMSSKSVQTDLTMTDLDKISDAFKASVMEVNQLKAKLKSLTEDILHLNEVYC